MKTVKTCHLTQLPYPNPNITASENKIPGSWVTILVIKGKKLWEELFDWRAVEELRNCQMLIPCKLLYVAYSICFLCNAQWCVLEGQNQTFWSKMYTSPVMGSNPTGSSQLRCIGYCI